MNTAICMQTPSASVLISVESLTISHDGVSDFRLGSTAVAVVKLVEQKKKKRRKKKKKKEKKKRERCLMKASNISFETRTYQTGCYQRNVMKRVLCAIGTGHVLLG